MIFSGFWSYVHEDDDAEGGRITQLARDIVAQYELLAGESIGLFLDRDDLAWGDEWRNKVNDSLASVAFFIPVLTPRYFLSVECRRETNEFIRKVKQRNLGELLMPILYVDFPAMHSDPSDDELIDLVKPFQWEDWSDLRFEDTNSSAYRRSVAKLAQRLVNANASAEDTAQIPAAPERGTALRDDDGEPGSLDVLQGAVDAMNEWFETLTEIGTNIADVGSIVESGTDEINRSSANPKTAIAVRIRVLKKVAGDLEPLVDRTEQLSRASAQNLYDIDAGVRYAIEQVPAELAAGDATTKQACEFFASIRELASSAEDALGRTESMIDAILPVENLSRDIRPVLRTLRKALTRMVEGRGVIRSWLVLIDATNVDC